MSSFSESMPRLPPMPGWKNCCLQPEKRWFRLTKHKVQTASRTRPAERRVIKQVVEQREFKDIRSIGEFSWPSFFTDPGSARRNNAVVQKIWTFTRSKRTV